MSKLEELVPPLELCKLIPKGEFEDSAFVWREDWCINDTNDDATHLLAWKIEKRGCCWVFPLKPTTNEVWAIRNQAFPITPIFVHNFHPAPTLQEILEVLPPYAENEHILACCVPDWADFNARAFGEHWRVGYTGDASICDKSPATAALKLWLKLKGIDYEK